MALERRAKDEKLMWAAYKKHCRWGFMCGINKEKWDVALFVENQGCESAIKVGL